MSFRRIEYFLSVAKHLNFTKAARECYVAQAAISQQIKQFEEELGFKLFNRGGASVSLTPAGEYFAKQCQAVLAQYNGAVKQARFLAEGKKRDLRLGINGPYTQECIPDYLRRFRQLYPEAAITLQEGGRKGDAGSLGGGEAGRHRHPGLRPGPGPAVRRAGAEQRAAQVYDRPPEPAGRAAVCGPLGAGGPDHLPHRRSVGRAPTRPGQTTWISWAWGQTRCSR